MSTANVEIFRSTAKELKLRTRRCNILASLDNATQYLLFSIDNSRLNDVLEGGRAVHKLEIEKEDFMYYCCLRRYARVNGK
jgi:hypothetical protein